MRSLHRSGGFFAALPCCPRGVACYVGPCSQALLVGRAALLPTRRSMLCWPLQSGIDKGFFRIWLLVTLLTKLWISPFFFFAKQYLRLLNILANLIFTPVAFEESFGFFLYPTWPNLVTLFPEDLLLLFSSGILHPKYQALLLAGSSWASEYLCTMGIFGCFSSENAFNHFRFYHWFLTIFGESYDFSTILDNFLVILWVFSFTVGLFFGTFNRVCFAVGLFFGTFKGRYLWAFAF